MDVPSCVVARNEGERENGAKIKYVVVARHYSVLFHLLHCRVPTVRSRAALARIFYFFDVSAVRGQLLC